MIQSTRHVLAVQNLRAATAYFVDVLGFDLDANAPPGWSFVSMDGFRLMLGECPDAVPAAATNDHAYFAHLMVDDVDTSYTRFKARGATFAADIADRPWGHREFCVRTPEGHRLVFAQIQAAARTAPVLSALNLVARNIDAMVGFYRQLGLDIPDTAVWQTTSGVHHVTARMRNGVALELDSAALARHYNAAWQPRQGPGSSCVIGFSLPTRAAVDDCYGKITGGGHRGLQPPYDAFWGARYAIVEDPDGNHVGLMSPSDTEHRGAGPAF